MTEEIKKKGMSKGCLIGLIVAGVLIVLVLITGVVCWVYKEDLVKFGANSLITGIMTEVTKNPPPGIDAENFSAVCTAFTEKMTADTLDAENLGVFMQDIQGIMADSKVDSAEAMMLMETMYEIYPELKDEVPYGVPEEPAEVIDSVEVETD